MFISSKPRLLRGLVWSSLALLALVLAGAVVFWIWPLHIQAHFEALGERLTERPTPEEWAAAEPRSLRNDNIPQDQDYFPENTFKPANDGTSFQEGWMAKSLKDLGEKSIYALRKDLGSQVYRLVWARSFDPIIVVRVEVQPDGSSQLISKHFALRPVNKGETTFAEKSLSRWQTSRIVAKFERSNFWITPAYEDVSGIDGSTWLFEGLREGTYHVVDCSSPKNGDPLKSLGLNLLETAGFWRGPVY